MILPGASRPIGEELLEALCERIAGCRICEAALPLGPRPIVRFSRTARILIIGQAPGVHASGVPWADDSGARLREWSYLPEERRLPLAQRVRAHSNTGSVMAPPHPSWRSTLFMRANPWFEAETLPALRAAVQARLG